MVHFVLGSYFQVMAALGDLYFFQIKNLFSIRFDFAVDLGLNVNLP